MKKYLHSMKIVKTLLLATAFTLLFSFCVFADWVNDGTGYKYVNSATNQYVVNNWLQTGNGYYFFNQNGYVVKGWYLINGNYYFFNEDGLMQTGFLKVNEKTYYLDKDTGKMVTGWIQTYNNGVIEYYYFDNNGVMCTGWKEINSKWFYFNDGKALIDTWAKINDVWYHMNANGSMDTGWINTNGKMYHLNVSNGSLTRGWIQDQYGNEYYLSEVDGSLMVNTTLNVNGITCTFDELGKCIAKNQFVGDLYGNTGNINYQGVAERGGSGIGVYGVNIGVEPGQNLIQGAKTSSQIQSQSQNSLTPGATAGPQ